MYPLQRQNPLNFGPLRKRRLGYGQDPTAQDPFQLPEDDEDNEQDNEQGTPIPGDRFSQLFNAAMAVPPGPAETRYAEHLSKGAPTPDQFKPGKINRLAAILGGASEGGLRGAGAGIRTARDVLETPYRRGMESYKLQSEQLGKAAQVESSMMGRKASFARTAANQEAAEARLAAKKVYDEKLFEHWERADKARAATARGAGFHWETSKVDGRIHGYRPDPSDPSKVLEWVGPKIGETPSETDKRDFDEFLGKEDVQQKNRVALERVRAEERENLENLRHEGRMKIREFAQNNKDWVFKEVKGGNYIAFDPTDPSKTVDTGVASGTMTEKDKIEAGINGRIKVDDNQAANTGIQRNKDAAANIERDRAKAASTAAAKTDDPRQQQYRIALRMRRFVALNGEDAKQYFEMDAAGNPTAMKGDPKDPKYARAYEYIYGKKAAK